MTEQCQEWIAHCVKKFPCKGSVLEVGSFDVNGNPRIHFSDQNRFPSYVGIDMREGPCVDKVMNTQAMDFADSSFDVIVDAERLEHDNRFWVTVKELYRVCKPGGYIIVTTRSWGGMHPHAYPHDYWRFMDSGLRDLLEYGGFHVLATAYGERWAAGDKAVFAVAQKPIEKQSSAERRPFHIVIPSANGHNLLECIHALSENDRAIPMGRVIVVDDGIDDVVANYLKAKGCKWVKGVKPFIFARNANLGIKAANSDVILLNDDALLQSENGFSKLAANPQDAISSAGIRGVVGNKNQLYQGGGVRIEPNMLCFVCVFIPKAAQDKIGLLDERFTGYGFEDNDYCTRAKANGISMLVDDRCVVEHKSLKPTFRSDPAWVDKMKQAQKIYAQKYQ